MTIERFTNLVWETARYYGQPYLQIHEVVKLRELIQIRLDEYCARTGCLTSDRVTLTPVVGESSADLLNTSDTTVISFGSRMASVENIFIEGAAMASYDSANPGPSSAGLAASEMTGYLIADNGRPTWWWMDNPKTVRFNCPFDQVYDDCFVSGRKLHSLLSEMTEHEELELDNMDIYAAADFCAARLLMVHSRERGEALEKNALIEMTRRTGESSDVRDGSSRRRSSRSPYYSLR
jgi:hypothetical protein